MGGCGLYELCIEVDNGFDECFCGFEEIGGEIGDDRIDELWGLMPDYFGILREEGFHAALGELTQD